MENKLTLETFLEYVLIMVITGIIVIVGNAIYADMNFIDSLPGMAVLFGIAVAGQTLAKLLPLPIPTVIYITIIGVLIAMPASPFSATVGTWVGSVQLLPLATPVLAYAGVSMGKDWAEFKKIGWRGILIAILVMIGTFVGSAIVAHLILSGQGII